MADELYIGLMSGTSLDAIDCALCSFGKAKTDNSVKLHATYLHQFPDEIRSQLLELINNPDTLDKESLGPLDRALGHVYAEAANELLRASGYAKNQITAIGNHGQTVMHDPDANPGFSLQLGDGQTIAKETGITTVIDFRNADMALGGQGAPLAPCLHNFAFARPNENKVILNLGGIANITVLPATGEITGYDTGPSNTLMDMWCNKHTGKHFDENGSWAKSGTVNSPLLKAMLEDDYFQLPPPKSTGREYFHLNWLQHYLDQTDPIDSADVQATLAELTAKTVADSISNSPRGDVLVCGGGVFNPYLMERIAAQLPDRCVTPLPEDILPPEWVEAAAFAWLARARIHNEPAGLPSVTGASAPALLGVIHNPPES
ncbi:MAG: anhydro-N-acetylmuramic acid kinase [Gammaproteobacteria bacterium]